MFHINATDKRFLQAGLEEDAPLKCSKKCTLTTAVTVDACEQLPMHQEWRLLTVIGQIVTKHPLQWLFIALLLTWMELSYFLMSVILCRTYKKVFYFQMSQTADVSIKVPLIWIHIAHSLNNTGLGCFSVSANLQAHIVL